MILTTLTLRLKNQGKQVAIQSFSFSPEDLKDPEDVRYHVTQCFRLQHLNSRQNFLDRNLLKQLCAFQDVTIDLEMTPVPQGEEVSQEDIKRWQTKATQLQEENTRLNNQLRQIMGQIGRLNATLQAAEEAKTIAENKLIEATLRLKKRKQQEELEAAKRSQHIQSPDEPDEGKGIEL